MRKRGSTVGQPLRGAGLGRTPVRTLLAVRQLHERSTALPVRPFPPAPEAAANPLPARRTLHDVVVAPPDGAAPLTLDELLTGWLSGLGASLEPDSFADLAEYARHVERMCRTQQAAEHLCRALDRRIADWVTLENDARPVAAAPGN